jgi:hypothetical protein
LGDDLDILRFVVMSAGLAIGVVIAVGLEDAVRSAVDVIRRSIL